MSNHEDIKELLEKKKLQQILLVGLSNSLKLKLTTTAKGKDKIGNIETKINLLKGLTTKISDKSLVSDDNSVLKFHQKQVKNAYETWDKNRETLVKILQIIAGNSLEIKSFIQESSEKLLPLSIEENGIKEDNFTDNLNILENNYVTENSFNYEENQEDEETSENDGENWIDEIENEIPESVNDGDESENFDDMPLDLGIVAEEEIFMDEEKEETEVVEENWDDFIEMPEEEIITDEAGINPDLESDSPSLEVNDDWEEWLEEENENSSTNHNGENEAGEIDWSEEEIK
ncbi:hypothetical protein [Geminocystis sp. GBBB08]|uniref:hypothetical protein n=1 Tax=Geminocystis sp. GBBB08 TaxID=2604140 RepID=UPI0027E27721|nr:hypothetical protein [Geminocystis sp. GBBB08]MBL1208854.1 hypothetical protein [Geminocystis sp. GBBB08]